MIERDFCLGEQADLLNQLDIAVLIVERDRGRIVFANHRVGRDMLRPVETMIGRHYRDVFWPDFIPAYESLAKKSEDGKEHTGTYYWNGKNIWEQISMHTIQLKSGVPAILMSITNINELMAEKLKYEQLAFYDAALGLPNSRRLEEDIKELTREDEDKVALLYFDIEDFSSFNELYGWDVGDELLSRIRDWMLKSERDKARLYRVDNGFALLGKNVTLDMTMSRARGIISRFKAPWKFEVANNVLSQYLTIHLGIIFGRYIKREMRGMLMRTLRAPHNVEGYTIYTDVLDAAIYNELSLRDQLINSAKKDMLGFEVYYQPIIDSRTSKCAGLEALCRWTLKDGTVISPDIFIPAAEKLGFIHGIDSWVCRTAVEYCASLGLNKKDFFLDINFSPWQRITDDVIDELDQLLSETGYPPEKLVIEITENAKISFDEELLDQYSRIREKGIVLSLDDFGTGYSSLENLIKLSAHTLKIDKTFVDGVELDEYRQYLLHTLVDVAKHLNMKVILEGVETKQQHDLLQDFGIDYYQGYYFSKPLPADRLQECLASLGFY